jgi:intein/homing endonuclease
MNIGKIYPIELNQKTAYIAGVIIGDGHISNSTKSSKDKSLDYRISIEVTELMFLINVTRMIKEVVTTKSTIRNKKLRERRKQLYYFQFRNKSFHQFLTQDLGIPLGNKCSVVTVPAKILSLPNLHWSFLAGLFDSDGGIRGTTIGFTSSSKKLIQQTSELLSELNVKHHAESWRNKKYNKYYYGIKIYKRSIDRFLKNLPMNNYEKRSNVFRHVDVPEWSNGQDNSLTTR